METVEKSKTDFPTVSTGIGKPSTQNAPGFPPVPTASTAVFFEGKKEKQPFLDGRGYGKLSVPSTPSFPQPRLAVRKKCQGISNL
jgi:hypothetical protein